MSGLQSAKARLTKQTQDAIARAKERGREGLGSSSRLQRMVCVCGCSQMVDSMSAQQREAVTSSQSARPR